MDAKEALAGLKSVSKVFESVETAIQILESADKARKEEATLKKNIANMQTQEGQLKDQISAAVKSLEDTKAELAAMTQELNQKRITHKRDIDAEDKAAKTAAQRLIEEKEKNNKEMASLQQLADSAKKELADVEGKLAARRADLKRLLEAV